MRLTKVRLKNFLSYAEQTFTDLATPGLVLLEGRNLDNPAFEANGAGKSALWDAVAWVLFGETLRGVKADEVVRRGSTDGCAVWLGLEHGGETYVVERARGKANILTLWQGDDSMGHDLTQGTMPLTQALIEQTFGIDLDLFRRTVVFAQGETFNFVEATDKAQKEILGKIVRLKVDDALRRARKAAEVSRETIATAQVEAAASRGLIDPARLAQLAAEADAWDAARDARRAEREWVLTEATERATAERDKYLNEDALQQALEKVSLRLRERADAVVSQQVMVNDALSQRSLAEGRLAGRAASLGGATACPTCEQPVDPAKVREELIRLEQEVARCRGLVTTNEGVLQDLTLRREKVKEHHTRVTVALDALHTAWGVTIPVLDQAVVTARTAVEMVGREENPLKGVFLREAAQQTQAEASLAAAERTIRERTAALAYEEFWVTGYGDQGLPSLVFDLVCEGLTAGANRYAGLLTGGEVTVTFKTQTTLKSGATRERFECEVLTGGARTSYAAYSGGERRRIALAVDLALSDLMADHYGSDFSLVVYDEQDQHMDDVGRRHYLKLLQEVAAKKRVFVVAHDAIFKAMFEHVWTIEKRGGVSTLKEAT